MSKEDAKEFHRRAKTDPAIQKALNDRTKSPEDVARDHGLHCTKEEIEAARREQDAEPSTEPQWCSYA